MGVKNDINVVEKFKLKIFLPIFLAFKQTT